MAAADTAKLVAQLLLDDKGFSRGLANAEKSLGNFEKTSLRVGARAGEGFKTAAGNLAKLTAIGAGIGVGLLAKSVQEASDLNEQLNKATVVFGKASDEVIAFSKTTADALGLAQSEALAAAGNFGNMFKTTGLAEEAAADMSTTLVTLASDMASFNDEDPSEMLDRLRSGLSGEAEPLRRFGVLLSEAAVQQEAYATGIAKTGEKLTEAQKVQARYSLIIKQTAVQQGDFARTNESFANLMRRITGNLKNAGATIGTALLPQVAKLASKLNTLILENQPAIEAFAAQLPGAFDKALAFAEKIPWASIGQGLQTAAEWAGKLFDVFLGLPPEVQTTLVALAGLNKLSGGAITGIVSELGKGLIKGVLGINAAQVNIKAATVTGVGGAPVAGAAPAGGVSGKVAAIGQATQSVIVVGLLQGAAAEIAGAVAGPIARQVQESVGGGPTNFFGPFERLMRALNGDLRSPLEVIQDQERQTAAATKATATISASAARESAVRDNASNERLEAIRAQNAANAAVVAAKITTTNSEIATTRAAEAQHAAALAGKIGTTNSELQTSRIAAATQAASVKATTAAGLADVRGAIQNKDLSVAVSTTNIINNTISARETIKTQTTYKNYQRFQS